MGRFHTATPPVPKLTDTCGIYVVYMGSRKEITLSGYACAVRFLFMQPSAAPLIQGERRSRVSNEEVTEGSVAHGVAAFGLREGSKAVALIAWFRWISRESRWEDSPKARALGWVIWCKWDTCVHS